MRSNCPGDFTIRSLRVVLENAPLIRGKVLESCSHGPEVHCDFSHIGMNRVYETRSSNSK